MRDLVIEEVAEEEEGETRGGQRVEDEEGGATGGDTEGRKIDGRDRETLRDLDRNHDRLNAGAEDLEAHMKGRGSSEIPRRRQTRRSSVGSREISWRKERKA